MKQNLCITVDFARKPFHYLMDSLRRFRMEFEFFQLALRGS